MGPYTDDVARMLMLGRCKEALSCLRINQTPGCAPLRRRTALVTLMAVHAPRTASNASHAANSSEPTRGEISPAINVPNGAV